MSNRIRWGILLLVCVALALSMASCAGARNRGPREFSVFVDFDQATKTVTSRPDETHVNTGDTVNWYASYPDLDVRFTSMPNPKCANGRCSVTIPPGYKGKHKYDVVLTVDNKPYRQDPVIIVDY